MDEKVKQKIVELLDNKRIEERERNKVTGYFDPFTLFAIYYHKLEMTLSLSNGKSLTGYIIDWDKNHHSTITMSNSLVESEMVFIEMIAINHIVSFYSKKDDLDKVKVIRGFRAEIEGQ